MASLPSAEAAQLSTCPGRESSPRWHALSCSRSRVGRPARLPTAATWLQQRARTPGGDRGGGASCAVKVRIADCTLSGDARRELDSVVRADLQDFRVVPAGPAPQTAAPTVLPGGHRGNGTQTAPPVSERCKEMVQTDAANLAARSWRERGHLTSGRRSSRLRFPRPMTARGIRTNRWQRRSVAPSAGLPRG